MKRVKMLKQKSGNLKKTLESQRKVREPETVLPLLRFNFMVSDSAKLLYQEVRENSLRSEKNQGKRRSKKVATLFKAYLDGF